MGRGCWPTVFITRKQCTIGRVLEYLFCCEVERDLEQGKLEPDVDAWIVWCLGLLADADSPDWTATYANDLDYNFTTWTLRSPLGDGLGLLDWR